MLSTESELPADDRRSPAWRATQLGAAFAAADDPTVKLTDRRWWATQTAERLAQSAALLGVHPGLAAPDADAIAFRLEVPRLVLRQAADAYAHARGRAARGRVLVGVIDQLGADACLLDRILAAGTCAGCWGDGDPLGSGEPGHARSGVPRSRRPRRVSRNRRRRRYEFCVVHGRRRAAQIARIEAQTHGRSKTCAYTPAALA